MSLALALAAVVSGASAFAQDLPSGYGTVSPSGSVFTTEISPATDTDDYVLQGFPGMALTATVKPSKGSVLEPAIEVIRPGGVSATDADGLVLAKKGTGVVASMVLDASGWWQVRVKSGATGVWDPQASHAYSVQIVYKLPPAQSTLPAVAKSFTKKGAIDSRIDVDDWYFRGNDGQTLAVALTRPKGSTLWPSLAVYDPDGNAVNGVTAFDGRSAGLATITMTKTGTWQVRVAGLEHPDDGDAKVNSNTTGAYVLAVKLGKLKVAKLLPDANGQYVFRIPAVGGATIGYSLTTDPVTPRPVFNRFVDPLGRLVSGLNNPETNVVGAYTLQPDLPIGDYLLSFDAPTPAPSNAKFSWKMIPPRPARGIHAVLAKDEPGIVLNGVSPKTGNGGTTLRVTTSGTVVDPNDQDATKVGVLLDHVACTGVLVSGTTLTAVVPVGLPLGFHDVVVRTSTGQQAVAPGAFEVIAPPTLTSIDPRVGSFAGGYETTIYGAGFLKLTDPRIVIDGLLNIIPADIRAVTDTSITFLMPQYGTEGTVRFGVVDATNNVGALLPPGSFEFVSSPAISRLVPNLTSVLGGDVIVVTGANFKATDHCWLETTTPGTYVEMTNSFVSSTRHQFTAPVRPHGVYHVYVTDQFGQPLPPRTRDLTYFEYANLGVTQQNTLPTGSDLWDGYTTAVADFDKDGDDDLFISRVAPGAIQSTSQTRILKNDGAGHFTDVTASVMAATTAADDWRADRVWLADMDRTMDGYPDMAIVSNDVSTLATGASHVRILANEPRTGNSGPTDRVFRDRTSDLMAPPRMAQPFSGAPYVADNWRGLDMWIGDLDHSGGQPEIIITHKETKQETDVSCVPVGCASPFAQNYTYGFYWGGSREFLWDKNAAGGQGRFKFNRDFFPRKGGLRVPVGMGIPICNGAPQYNQPCVNRFTPFLGKRVDAGDLDVDANGVGAAGLLDVAVVSDDVVQRIYPPSATLVNISSLQVGINRFNTSDGALVTDVTGDLNTLGGDNRADSIAIGQPGYPDGASRGFIAIAKATSQGVLALRMLKFDIGNIQPGHFAAFADVTSQMMPAPNGADRWQASRIIFKDVDGDGDQDMLLVANAAPGGTEPAFRILRNDVVNSQVGVFRESLRKLIVGDASASVAPLIGGTEFLEGDTMSVGDVDKDGAVDFILTRNNTTSPSPETRIIVNRH